MNSSFSSRIMTCSTAKTFAEKIEKNIESNIIFIEHAPLCRHSTSDVSSDVRIDKIRPTNKRFLPCAGAAGAPDAGIRWLRATKPHVLVWRPEAFSEWFRVALRRSSPMPKKPLSIMEKVSHRCIVQEQYADQERTTPPYTRTGLRQGDYRLSLLRPCKLQGIRSGCIP